MSTTTKRLLAIGAAGIALNLFLRAFMISDSPGLVMLESLPPTAWKCAIGALCTGTAAAVLASRKRERGEDKIGD